jgi:cytochrome c oxidase cbb3-type subunit 4
MSLDMNLVRIAVTVLSFAAFMGILAYVASPRNRERFEEAARLPFDEDPLPNPLPRERGQTSAAVSRNGGIDR